MGGETDSCSGPFRLVRRIRDFPPDTLSWPKSIILALWERDGLLCVLIQDADADWKPSAESERLLEPKLRNSKYDSVLETVDPR